MTFELHFYVLPTEAYCNDPNRSAKLRTCKFFFFILNFKNQFNQNFLEPSIFGAEMLVSWKFYFIGAFVGKNRTTALK
jgi:hypothetical protein